MRTTLADIVLLVIVAVLFGLRYAFPSKGQEDLFANETGFANRWS